MYTVLEVFDENNIVVINQEEGSTEQFSTSELEEAKVKAEECQKGVIVFVPEYYRGEKIDAKKRVKDNLRNILRHFHAFGKIDIEDANQLKGATEDIEKYLF